MSPEKLMKGHCVLTQSVVNEAMSSWLLFVVSQAGLCQPPAGLRNLFKWITNLFEQTSNRPLSDVG